MRGAFRKWTVLILAAGALWAGKVTTLAAQQPLTARSRTTAPFVVRYAQQGKTTGDLGELYQLCNGNEVIRVYRAAPGADAAADSYRRINLEDGTDEADQLRAVILGGYPQLGAESLAVRANVWLRGKGLPEITHLQTGEALLATQIAVWEIAQPDFSVEDYGSRWKDLDSTSWAGYREQGTDSVLLLQEPTEYTSWNVEGLCRYLCSLPPVQAKKVTASDGVLTDLYYRGTKQADTYTISAKATVSVDISPGDSLTLTAACGECIQEQKVEKGGTYEFVFEGQPDKYPVELTLAGTQRGGDVYFYQSQDTLLVGWDDSTLAVRGTACLTPDRVLRLKKTTDQGDPLANIQFNLYLAATREQLDSGLVRLGNQPTAAEIAQYQTAENLTAILSTDENGTAEYNFTSAGNPDGIYLVVEQFSAATTGPVEPFYLTVPGSDERYDLEVLLENALESQPNVVVNVTQEGTTSDSFAVGTSHTWILRGDIPSGLAGAQRYTIIDVLEDALDYENDSVTVSLHTGTGTELLLAKDVHYTLVEDMALRVSLTPAGMAYAAANRGAGEGELRIRFRAAISSGAPMGVQIRNRAQLEYINSAGIVYSKTSDPAQVHTGGIALRKTDTGGIPLTGAAYCLARDAKPGEEGTQPLLVGEQTHSVVYVTFYPNRDMTGDKVAQTQTDGEGRAWFSGLAYGVYYLVEVEGTGGHRPDPQPVVVTVDSLSHLDGSDGDADNTLLLTSGYFLLPDAQTIGVPVLTMVGIAAVLSACVLLINNRRRVYFR